MLTPDGYEANITLFPKPDGHNREKELQTYIPNEHRCKNIQQNATNRIQ